MDRILWDHGCESVDEIVVENCTFHLEQMSDTSYWIGIYKDGNFDRSLAVRLSHGGKKMLTCTVEDTSDFSGGLPWHWDSDKEHG